MTRCSRHGATAQDLLALYRPRPGLPFTTVTLANGQKKILWTTFTPSQVDIDVLHPQGRAYLQGILARLAGSGIRMVRLDAVGYALKKAGASSFMMAETFDFIGEFAAQARALGIEGAGGDSQPPPATDRDRAAGRLGSTTSRCPRWCCTPSPSTPPSR